jgi:hypothetical protein
MVLVLVVIRTAPPPANVQVTTVIFLPIYSVKVVLGKVKAKVNHLFILRLSVFHYLVQTLQRN